MLRSNSSTVQKFLIGFARNPTGRLMASEGLNPTPPLWPCPCVRVASWHDTASGCRRSTARVMGVVLGGDAGCR